MYFTLQWQTEAIYRIMVEIIRLKYLLVSITFRAIHRRSIWVVDFLITHLFYSKQTHLKMWQMNELLIQEKWRVGSTFRLHLSFNSSNCRCVLESCCWVSAYSCWINVVACCRQSPSLAFRPLCEWDTGIDWLQWIFRYSFTTRSITSFEFTGTLWDTFKLTFIKH